MQGERQMREVGPLADGRVLYHADESFERPGYMVWDPIDGEHIQVVVVAQDRVEGILADAVTLVEVAAETVCEPRRFHESKGGEQARLSDALTKVRRRIADLEAER